MSIPHHAQNNSETNNSYSRRSRRTDPFKFYRAPKHLSSPKFYQQALQFDPKTTDQLRQENDPGEIFFFDYLRNSVRIIDRMYPTIPGNESTRRNAIAINNSDYYNGYHFTLTIPLVNLSPVNDGTFHLPREPYSYTNTYCDHTTLVLFQSKFSILSPAYGWDKLVDHFGINLVVACNRFSDRYTYLTNTKGKKKRSLVFHYLDDVTDIGRYMFFKFSTPKKIPFLWIDIDLEGDNKKKSGNPFTINTELAQKLAHLDAIGITIAAMTVNIVNSRIQIAIPIDPILITSNSHKPLWFYQTVREILISFLGGDKHVGHQSLVRNLFMVGIEPRIVSFNAQAPNPAKTLKVKHPHLTYVNDQWVKNCAVHRCQDLYQILSHDQTIGNFLTKNNRLTKTLTNEPATRTASIPECYPHREHRNKKVPFKTIYLRLDPNDHSPLEKRKAQRRISAHVAAVRASFILYFRGEFTKDHITDSIIEAVMMVYIYVYDIAHQRNQKLGISQPYLLPSQDTIRGYALSCLLYVIRDKEKITHPTSIITVTTNHFSHTQCIDVITDSPQHRGGVIASRSMRDKNSKRYKNHLHVLRQQAQKRHKQTLPIAQQVYDEHQKGISISKLAQKYDLSKSTICRYLRLGKKTD